MAFIQKMITLSWQGSESWVRQGNTMMWNLRGKEILGYMEMW